QLGPQYSRWSRNVHGEHGAVAQVQIRREQVASVPLGLAESAESSKLQSAGESSGYSQRRDDQPRGDESEFDLGRAVGVLGKEIFDAEEDAEKTHARIFGIWKERVCTRAGFTVAAWCLCVKNLKFLASPPDVFACPFIRRPRNVRWKTSARRCSTWCATSKRTRPPAVSRFATCWTTIAHSSTPAPSTSSRGFPSRAAYNPWWQ